MTSIKNTHPEEDNSEVNSMKSDPGTLADLLNYIKICFAVNTQVATKIYDTAKPVLLKYSVNIYAEQKDLLEQAYIELSAKNILSGFNKDLPEIVAYEISRLVFHNTYHGISYIRKQIITELEAVLTWNESETEENKKNLIQSLVFKVYRSHPVFKTNPEFLQDYFHSSIEKLLLKEEQSRNIAFLYSFMCRRNSLFEFLKKSFDGYNQIKPPSQFHELEVVADSIGRLFSTFHTANQNQEKPVTFFNAIKKLSSAKNNKMMLGLVLKVIEDYEMVGSVDENFWDNVKAKWIEENMEYYKRSEERAESSFRQQKKRILDVLKDIKWTLRMGQRDYNVFADSKLAYILADPSCLVPYRFSGSDLKHISKLLKLFSKGGYVKKVLPEIYQVDLSEDGDDFKLLLPELHRTLFEQGSELWDKHQSLYKESKKYGGVDEGFSAGGDFNLELLGMYIPDFTDEPCSTCGYLVEEGKIVLFTDRIKKFAELHRPNDNDAEGRIRSCVLIHELSHWASHYLDDFHDSKWNCEYYYHADTGIMDVNTHEFLAQFFTWNVIRKEENTKHDFETLLTPRNPSDPYALYTRFKETDPNFVLSRMAEVRSGCKCDLPDMELFHFLTGTIH